MSTRTAVLREHAEQQFSEELQQLGKIDTRTRPPNWNLSPWAVAQYLSGTRLDNGFEVFPKYIWRSKADGDRDRHPRHRPGAIVVRCPRYGQNLGLRTPCRGNLGRFDSPGSGHRGISEEAIRYGWNYARLLAEGPSLQALVASPIMRAMEDGKIARVEELTRIPADVQDSLITLLSEKTLPIPELNAEVQARKGFNVVATANDRDRGVNELSSALKRRFNTVMLPLPATIDEEVDIVQRRTESIGRALELPAEPPAMEEIRRIVTIFRELRSGLTLDGKTKIKSPSGTLSTAEAISVVNKDGRWRPILGMGAAGERHCSSLVGAVVRDPVQDRIVWQEYLETVLKERNGWKDLYRSCREIG